jgi:hypothetical protein
MNLGEDLVRDVDAYAAQMHVSRTAAVSFLLSSALSGIELVDAVKEQKRKERAKKPKAE